MSVNPIIEQLKTLRDEVKVQSHLFTLEAKDELNILETKFEAIFKSIGDFNEEFWAGNKDEINKLVKEYEAIKASQVDR